MKTFLNNHPFVALAMLGTICATILVKEYMKKPDIKVVCMGKDDCEEPNDVNNKEKSEE